MCRGMAPYAPGIKAAADTWSAPGTISGPSIGPPHGSESGPSAVSVFKRLPGGPSGPNGSRRSKADCPALTFAWRSAQPPLPPLPTSCPD